jgi:uncharacterized protein YlzI (FlbEa/FlbD family)
MVTMIILTRDDQRIEVNADHILWLEQDPSGAGTLIRFVNGEQMVVAEDPLFVSSRINQSC